MQMFHNGSYALCDVAPHCYENMSNINIVSGRRQVTQPRVFHNDWEGVVSLLEDPSRGHPGGKVRAPRYTLVPTPRTFPSDTQGVSF